MNPLRSLMVLVGVYYFLQAVGGNPGFHFQSLQKYLKEALKFSPTEMSAFISMLIIPWTIKPVYGLISDFFPIFGLRRKSYFIFTGIAGLGAYLALSFIGLSREAILICLFVAAVSFAFSDVLCDAVMVEKGQLLNATDRLQSVQWAASGFAGVLIAFTKGYIAQYWTFQQALWLVAIPPVLVVLFTLLALKEEPVQSSGETAKQAWGGLKQAISSKILWGTAIFLFLFNCNPNLGSVLYYYEKDVLKFSDVLIGHIDTVGSLGFLVGALLYGLVSKYLSHKKLLVTIIITGIIGNLSFLWLRDENSAYIVSGFSSVVAVIAFLGTLTVAAKACPKYAEGTVFALIMSVMNLGVRVGDYSGSYLWEKFTVAEKLDPRLAYAKLVVIAAIFTAAMVLFLWMAKEEKKENDNPA